jgi:hypothetical protein
MDGTLGPDGPTTELSDHRVFPEPAAVISLRQATTYRDLDDDGQPMLIITDGVTSVALDSGLSGLSFGVVVASQRLADAVADFARSVKAGWQSRDRPSNGLRRRNRRQISSRLRLGNNARR